MTNIKNIVFPLYDFGSPKSLYHCSRDTDCAQLISLVQEHPELYDTDHEDYMRTRLKEEVWVKIGEAMNIPSHAVKNKWLNLRDCHRQALRIEKKNRSGLVVGTFKPWLYQKEMEFLLPFMEQKIKSNSQESAEKESTSENKEEAEYASDDEEAGCGSDDKEEDDDDDQPFRYEDSDHYNLCPPIYRILKFRKEPVNLNELYTAPNAIKDAVRDYLQELIPDMPKRPMSPKREKELNTSKLLLQAVKMAKEERKEEERAQEDKDFGLEGAKSDDRSESMEVTSTQLTEEERVLRRYKRYALMSMSLKDKRKKLKKSTPTSTSV